MKNSSTHKNIPKNSRTKSKNKENSSDHLGNRNHVKKTTNKSQMMNYHKKKKDKRKRQKRSFLYEVILTLTIFFIIILSIYFFTIRIIKVDGYAMTPLINDEDRLLVIKHKNIRRFDIVAFKNPHNSEKIVQRVVGLPGEEIVYKEGALFVNGNEIPERFLTEWVSLDGLTNSFSLNELGLGNRIPEDGYFILGDNREYASDSRYFGYVKKENIIGIIKARIFPVHKIQQL